MNKKNSMLSCVTGMPTSGELLEVESFSYSKYTSLLWHMKLRYRV
jgi:hypothetical protein